MRKKRWLAVQISMFRFQTAKRKSEAWNFLLLATNREGLRLPTGKAIAKPLR